jgi:hypothetical protein
MDVYGYIYITTNTINNKRYIGQHKSKDWGSKYFGSGKHLKYAINKYGIKNFTCFPLAWAWNKKEIDQLEIDYIVYYKPEYNIAIGGSGCNGYKHSEEHKKRIGEIHKGKIISEETRKKISEAHKGIQTRLGAKLSEESKKKIGEANKGKHWKLSEETRIKMSEANRGKLFSFSFKGKHHSEGTKKRLSESQKGEKPYIITDEIRKKMGESQRKRRIREAVLSFGEDIDYIYKDNYVSI